MTETIRSIIGWDVGGVNVKAALVQGDGTGPKGLVSAVRPFEIWRQPQNLTTILQEMVREMGGSPDGPMAVTMTAELSDVFRVKREGVNYVLEAVERAFQGADIYPFTLDGRFVDLARARRDPLACAATNWLASAQFLAAKHPDCLLVDIGSTTTDIIPIRGGKAAPFGRTDTQRLTSGELVYTGVLRTNPNTLTGQVPDQGRSCRLAAEYFTIMADVYLILGQLSPEQYSCPTPDGRGRTVAEARERLARLVCADAETMSETALFHLAAYLREKQIQQIVEAMWQVVTGLGDGDSANLPLAAVGSGLFLAREAARRLDKKLIDLEDAWDPRALAVFPALAVASLLAGQGEVGSDD